MGITVTATSIQPKDITINETGEKITITDSTATVSNIIKDTLTLTLAGSNTNLGDLANVEITSVADGQLLVYESSSSKWKNSASSTGVTSVNTQTGAVTLDTDDIQEDGSPTNRYFTDARARGVLSVTDAGGDGSLAYNSSTGVFTYTGPSASETRAHFTAGAGLTLTDGEYSIGNDAIKDTMIDFGTGANQVSTADIPEQTNLYYTDSRVQTKIDANSAGFITASSTDTLTNKSGNISQWTNDAGYVTPSSTDTLTNKTFDANGTGNSLSNVEVADFAAASIVTASEGVGSNNNDTTIPTSAAVKAYADSVGGGGTITALNNQAENRLVSIGATTTELDGEANLTFNGTTLALTGQQTITNTTTDDSLLITTTEDSSTAAPVLTFKRNSASPANGDYLGQIKWKGENDADQEVIYAKMTGKISDETDTTEDGILEFALRKAGSNNIGMRLTSTQLKMLNGTGLELAGDLDTNGANIVDGTGAVTVADAFAVTVTSGGTRHTEFTNSSATGSGFQSTLGTGGVAHTSGNHYIYRTATTTGFSTKATLAGDGTHTFEADSSAHGSTMPLVLKSTNSGFNRQQLRLTDAGNSQTDLVARKAGDSQILQFVLDTGANTTYATGDAVGDHAVYHIKDGANDRVNTTIYGANDQHRYSVFQGNSGSYDPGDMVIDANKLTAELDTQMVVDGSTSYLDQTVLRVVSDDTGYGRSQLELADSNSKGEVHFNAFGGTTGGGDDVGDIQIHLDVASTPASGDFAGDYLHQLRRNQTQDRMEWNVFGANNKFVLQTFKGNSGSYGYTEFEVNSGLIDLNANGNFTLDATDITLTATGDTSIQSAGSITMNVDSNSAGNELFKLQESGTDVISFNRGPGNDAEVVIAGDGIFIKDENNNTLFSIDASGSQQGGSFVNTDRTKTGILELKRNDSGTTTYNTSYTFRADANDRKFYLEVSDNAGSDGVTEIFSVEDSGGSATATPKDIVKFSIPPVLPSFTVANLPTTVVAGAQAFCTNETGGAVPVFYDGTNWRRVTDRNVASA